jgi:hypothetical protein
MGTSVLDETQSMSVERLANTRYIEVGAETIEIGPLVLNQLLALGRLIAGLLAKLDVQQVSVMFAVLNALMSRRGVPAAADSPAVTAEIADIERKRTKGPAKVPAGTKRSGPTPSNGSTTPAAPSLDWMPLLMLLDDETWGQAAHIVTGRPAEWCLGSLTLPSIGLLIEAVLDLNDTEVLRRLFTRAASPPTPSTISSDRDS